MISADPLHADRRVMILAPRGRDAAVVAHVLTGVGFETSTCRSLTELVAGMEEGAGLCILTEEVLQEGGLDALTAWLLRQPTWSDIPLLILATKQVGRRSPRAMATLEDLGNVILLERPLNAETIISAGRSALRSRARQYNARHHLEEQARFSHEIERLHHLERQARLQALDATEALSLALDAAELGTFHCPVPFGEIVWNSTCKMHFWLPPDAQVDFDLFYSLIHPDDRERTRASIRDALELRTPYDVEYRTLSPSGQTRWLRAKGRAYFDGNGAPTRFDGITIDISRQKELELARASLFAAERQAREQAEHASRVKDEFLATLSHELRTPLSAILGWVYVLKKRGPKSEADLSKATDTIERNARAQSLLIDELLDMSRIIAGNVSLDLQPVVIGDIVETVIGSLQPAAQAKSIGIEFTRASGVGSIAGDGHRLQQIAVNLLTNAIKFTDPGGLVRVDLKTENDEVVLTVADDGRGISADFLPLVFERFRQADGSATRSHGGLGLGLSIVRDLVELHGGAVQVKSEGLGRGSTFTVRLLARAAIPRTEAATGAPENSAPTDVSASGLEGVRILLVDDEADGREMLARILTDSGAITTLAASAEEALAESQRGRHDLLISDIGMPKQDGYELLRRLRLLGHAMPAIALTAFAQSEDRQRALAAGYAVHMSKPVEPPELFSAIRQLRAMPLG